MTETKTIVIERIFDAPVERVWKAWTDQAEVGKWWGPRGFVSPDNMLDLRVGGKYNFSMQATGELAKQLGDRLTYSGGEYKEIIEYKKLVYTDVFTDKDGNMVPPSTYGMADEAFPEGPTTVTVEFEPTADGKTKLTVRWEGAPVGEHGDQANAGWNEMLDKLSENLQ